MALCNCNYMGLITHGLGGHSLPGTHLVGLSCPRAMDVFASHTVGVNTTVIFRAHNVVT